MGLTQQVHGFDNIGMFVNLLLMRGNIGRDGTGISPVHGHSNVQGQRTVGISEKPELVPLDRLEEMFSFTAPREKGLTTVDPCQGILDDTVKAFIGLGGDFVRAIPEQGAMEEAWSRMRLTVQIATKLNRSHLFNDDVAYLLPCLGRSEEDLQEAGPQIVTIEDTFSCIHGSNAKRKPASAHLKPELAIVAGVSPNKPSPPTRRFGGTHGRATTRRCATGFEDSAGRYRLITLRSNDQFNTTVDGYSDRLRGIEGTRSVLLISPSEIRKAGLREGQVVGLASDADDGRKRYVRGLTVTPFDLQDGCIAGYYPELNPLIPLSHHDQHSKTPASKAVPVQIVT